MHKLNPYNPNALIFTQIYHKYYTILGVSHRFSLVPIPAVHVEDLIAEGKMKPEQIDDLGDVLLGRVPVHRKDDEIVIYSVGGMPTEDVAWGTCVYRNAVEKGIGTKLNLWDTPKMV